jgi:TaqI-like C-terminal specificity domain/Eco57I restriction-modification methylase
VGAAGYDRPGRDVEPVTKAFFKKYKEVFERVEVMIEGLDDAGDRRLFCQALFNRLMFLCFLQRKGCLMFGGDTDYLHALWKDYLSRGAGADEQNVLDAGRVTHNFYSTRLRLLFFTALANARSSDFDQARAAWVPVVGDVPFLNRGLFSEDRLDGVPVLVPDEAVGLIIEDLFDRFNFTITESTPTDIQVAVDPEMLGKVFEELVTGRHEQGAYYTPRPIVHFMCQEGIKGFLYTRVSDVPRDAINRFVEDHDVAGLSDEQALRIVDALGDIRVVDLACGSGAYLLGMLQELLELRRLIWNERLRRDPQRDYDLKLHIIEKNVYGVDIDQFAVNVAMLRLWLSLTVDYEGAMPQPLPNLDYKIVCGNSLTAANPSVAAGLFAAPQPGQTEQAQGTLVQSAAFQLSADIVERRADFYRAVGDEKLALKRRIDASEAELNGLLPHVEGSGKDSVDWAVQFAEVFAVGGFDVVLANPPYVRQELIRDQKPALKRVYGDLFSGTADLYVYFYYRALQLLRPGGMLVFISSNKWMRAAYATGLRRLLGEKAAVWSITNFGDLPVFQETIAYPLVLVAQAGAPAASLRYADVPSLGLPYPDVRAVAALYGTDRPVEAGRAADPWPPPDRETARFIRQMEENSIPLAEYVKGQIYYGIKTGLNEAFVIDGATRERLIREDARSEEIIKPFAVGKDVRRWTIATPTNWLIFTRRGIKLEEYPAVQRHLQPWRARLEPKKLSDDPVGRKPGRYKWYECQDDIAYYRFFEVPKIVFADIATEARFALDRNLLYADTTLFIIPVDDLFLLGVLNSAAVDAWYRTVSPSIRGGFLRFKRQYVERIPIPSASPQQREMVAISAVACATAVAAKESTPGCQAQLDAVVGELYAPR